MGQFRRREFLVGGGALLAAPFAHAQQSQSRRSPARVGILLGGSPSTSGHILDEFKQSMRERGYVEGGSVVFEVAYAEGQVDRLAALAKGLVASRPDVLVSASPQMIKVLQQAAGPIPIVMAQVTDPVSNGFVKSLARPGGNITGIANQYEEVLPKIFEILVALVPKLERAGVIVNETHSQHAHFWATSVKVLDGFGRKALRFATSRMEDIDPVFVAMTQQGVQAIVVTPDAFLLAHRRKIADLALHHRLPAGYGITEHVNAGGLFGYGPDLISNYRRAAYFVDRILKGANPGDLPVEQPTKFELIINMKTAKALSLTIPPSILVRADRVIE